MQPTRARRLRISTAAILSFVLFSISTVLIVSGVPIYQGFILSFVLALYVVFEVLLGRSSSKGILLILLPLVVPVVGYGAMYVQLFAEQTGCSFNMGEITYALLEYGQDHNERLPDPQKWCDLLVDANYISRSQLRCTGDKVGPSSYAINPNAKFVGPSDTVILFECKPGWNQHGGPELLDPSRHDGCLVLFADGHKELVSPDRFPSLRWSGDPNSLPK